VILLLTDSKITLFAQTVMKEIEGKIGMVLD
jgi:hypothetical protein